MPILRPAALVFDLDGTLIDSRGDITTAANLTREGYGLPPLTLEQVVTMVGEGARLLIERALPESISRWFPRTVHTLGTDGFGRSEGREALRDFFEVDARFVVLATLVALLRDGQIEAAVVQQAMKDLNIDPEKINPMVA